MLCPNCNSNTKILFDDAKDYFVNKGISENFGIIACTNCHLFHSFPKIDNNLWEKYYPNNFEAYVNKGFLSNWLQNIKYKKDLKLLQKNCKSKITTLFEVGAGRASFLNVVKQNNIIVEGIEPSIDGVNQAMKTYHIELEQKKANNYIFKKKYDVVVIRHVLEHLDDYKTCLNNIFSNGLNENGLLFIKIPNCDCWEAKFFKKYWHGYDLPRHRVHFTSRGISKLLEDMGFNNIQIKKEIVALDFVRSLQNFLRYSNKPVLKFLFFPLFIVPNFILLLAFQPIVKILSINNASRIVVLAKK